MEGINHQTKKGILPCRSLFLHAALVVIFTLIALIGIPFRYDEGNSGRYLLRVIKSADPELFRDDPVVESLNRFKSLFYISLAKVYEITGASPQSVEQTIYILYVVSKFLLMVAMLFVAQSLSHEVMLFILLAAWASYMQWAPIGGEGLFKNQMTHTTISELLGLIALCFLFRQRYFYFWLSLSFSILIHPLNTAHLALCIIPAIFFFNRYFVKTNIIGLILFLSSSFLYFLFLSPPSFSAEEAQIFLNAKGNMSHISPLNQSPVGWMQMLLLIALALLGLRHIEKPNLNDRLIAWSIVSGTLIALVLSSTAVFTEWVRLVQFQPMRIFTWVTFFTYLLLAIVAVKVWHYIPMISILFVAIFALDIIGSLWALSFILISIANLIILGFVGKQGGNIDFCNKFVITGVVVIVVLMFLLWVISKQLSFPISTFLNPLPLGVGALLLVLVSLSQKKYSIRTVLFIVVIGYSLLGGAIHWHFYYDSQDHPEWDASIYKARTHPDWDAVRRWCREHTPKDARFIVAGGYGSFRTLAWRTAIGESMSALAWVDPLEYARNEEQYQKVLSTCEDGVWNINKLFSLAKQWGIDYIIVNGSYKPSVYPILRVGTFSIFKVPCTKLMNECSIESSHNFGLKNKKEK